MKTFWSYFRFQLRSLILRLRWLLMLPVLGFIVYLLGNALNPSGFPIWDNPLVPNPFGQIVSDFNAWDALFIAFGNAYYMTFAIANLYLLLVCDSLPEKEFGQLALFRMGSRTKWWLAKSLSVLAAALLYILLSMLIILIGAGLRIGFDWNWSQFGTIGSNILIMPLHQIGYFPPWTIALLILALCTLGFWAFGMLMQVIALLTRRPIYGYLTAMILLIGGMGASERLINVPRQLRLLPPLRNLILTHWPYPFRQAPISWSFYYWVFLLAVLFVSGLVFSRKHNFFSKHQPKEDDI